MSKTTPLRSHCVTTPRQLTHCSPVQRYVAAGSVMPNRQDRQTCKVNSPLAGLSRADQNNKINNPTRSGSHHAEDVTSACGNPVSPMLEWILLRTVRMLSRHRPRQSRSPLPLLLLLALPHGPVITRPAVNAQTLISYLSHTPHHYTQWVGGENITSLQGILIVR